MPHIAEMSQELDRLEPHLPLLLEHLPVPSSPLHCTALHCAVLLNCASGWRTYHYRAGTVCVWCGQDLIPQMGRLLEEKEVLFPHMGTILPAMTWLVSHPPPP